MGGRLFIFLCFCCMVTMTIMTIRYPFIFWGIWPWCFHSLGFGEVVQYLLGRDETVALNGTWRGHKTLICVSFITCTSSWICNPQSIHETYPNLYHYCSGVPDILPPTSLCLVFSPMESMQRCTAGRGFLYAQIYLCTAAYISATFPSSRSSHLTSTGLVI